MGIYGTNSCKVNSKIYPIVYLLIIITFVIIGGLYEGEILPRNNDYTKNSVWWYGFIGVIGVGLLLPCLNWLLANRSENTKTYVWYASHILCYFAIAFVSPGQWPFWLAIGITWELFECYLSCGMTKKGYPITCSGMYDITANLAGIAIAMWIRSEIPVDGL
jgi:hypothetical protein